jgi:hypothetical protein
MQKEAERQQKKLVRDNEKMKEVRRALSQTDSSQYCTNSDTGSSKSTASENS